MEDVRKAVALQYDKDKDVAPKVTAKGQGFIAGKILEVAKEYDIPLYEDPDLLESLMPLEVDMEVPPKLYKAVAEVIAYVYNLKHKLV